MIWPFYLMAIVAIVSTIKVVTNTNPVHALLNLIVSLLAVAGLFFIVGAPFAGALEVIVYAGAIMVLFVFVVMMLNLGEETRHQEKLWLNSSAWVVPALLSFLIGLTLVWMLSSGDTTQHPKLGAGAVSAKEVGIALFGPYLLLVEIAAMLLLAALVAAFHLGKKHPLNHDKENHDSQDYDAQGYASQKHELENEVQP